MDMKCCDAPLPIRQWNKVVCMNCKAEQMIMFPEGEPNEQPEEGAGDQSGEQGSGESTEQGTGGEKTARKRGVS